MHRQEWFHSKDMLARASTSKPLRVIKTMRSKLLQMRDLAQLQLKCADHQCYRCFKRDG